MAALTAAAALPAMLAGGHTPPAHSDPAQLAAATTGYDDRADLDELHRRAVDAARADRATRAAAAVTAPPPPVTTAEPPAGRHRAKPSPRPRTPRRTTPVQVPPAVSGDITAVIGWALAQVGHPYVYGATGPGAYDCSGLVAAAYARIGVRLPHSAAGMLAYGRPVGRGELAPGDLVFASRGHVAIYIGGGRIVEAANPAVGVVARPIWGFMTARRL